jgi:hypothetical protein
MPTMVPAVLILTFGRAKNRLKPIRVNLSFAGKTAFFFFLNARQDERVFVF